MYQTFLYVLIEVVEKTRFTSEILCDDGNTSESVKFTKNWSKL